MLLASATIANPVELAERLTGLEDFALVDRDASPAPERKIAIWNPPLTDEASGARRSALGEAAELLAGLVRQGARMICFMKSRKGVEVLSRLVRDDLADEDPELAERVAPYRAGYTPQQRRELEQRLMRGELRAIVTTDALELGIDIGELDAALVVTFPGTVASLRQMWGRAGRRGRGLAVYVAGEDALDQFFCRHPDEFLDRPVEAAILDHESPLIYRRHLLCAAHEGPLSRADAEFFGPRWEAAAELLESAGELRRREGVAGTTYVLRRPGATRRPRSRCARPRPRASRSSTSPPASCSGPPRRRARTRRSTRARSTCTSGAPTRCASSTSSAGARSCRPFSGDWYTQPKRNTDTEIVRLLDRRETLGVQLSFGEVSVTETVLAYQRRRLADHSQLDLFALDLPPTSFETQALWFELDAGELAERVSMEQLLGLAARDRARPDRGAAADRDVRPLGHRRPLDERAPADGRADDLPLRRPPRRHRHHADCLRTLRGAVRRRAPSDRRMRLRERLPVLRAVAEVREPQRAALEGRRAAGARPAARRRCGGPRRQPQRRARRRRSDRRLRLLVQEKRAGPGEPQVREPLPRHLALHSLQARASRP